MLLHWPSRLVSSQLLLRQSKQLLAVIPEPLPDDSVVVAEVGRAYGIKGWVWLQVYSRPVENLKRYTPLWLHQKDDRTASRVEIEALHCSSKGVRARINGVVDRNQAEAIRGQMLSVAADQLPPSDDESPLWRDLIGCTVKTEQGQSLGVVQGLMETGANDVLVVNGDRERLIPYVPEQYIKQVVLADRLLIVDWDPEF